MGNSVELMQKNITHNKWKKYKFNQIASLVKNQFNPKKIHNPKICIELENIQSETGQLLGYFSTQELSSTKLRFQTNDVLFGKLRPYLNKYIYANFSGVCSTEIWVLRANVENCLPRYLFYLVQHSTFLKFANITAGTKMPRSDWNVVKELELKLPPLKEQKKIAEILSNCDRAIELTEKLIASKQKLKRGLMQKLLTGKLRFPEFEGQKWDTKKIGDIANVKMGHSPPSSSYNKIEEGIPLVQGMSNVRNGLANPKAWTKVITQLANSESILLSVRAPVGTIAKTNIEVCVGRGFAIIEAKPNHISKDFLFYFLEMNKEKWRKFSQGSTFESITSSEVKKFPVLKPNKIQEQEAITQVISLIDQEVEKLGVKKDYLQKTKKGLMQQLLTGKTRVPLNQ